MAKGTKIKSAGGIGESKIFCAPEETRLPGGVDRILKCHIDGVKVSDLNLAPQVLSALDYFMTDEGIKERENAPMARPSSGITLGADGFDKALQQRRDDVKERDMALFEARDPMKEVADAHAVPGMKAKFLSASRVKENGGTGIFKVVKEPNGDPVSVKGMVLAHAPIKVTEARNRHYQEKGNALLKQITETYKREGGATAVADQ